MDWITALIVVGWVVTIIGFLYYITKRDLREQELLDRIQAPEMAVTRAFNGDGTKAKVSYAGEEEEDAPAT